MVMKMETGKTKLKKVLMPVKFPINAAKIYKKTPMGKQFSRGKI